MELQIVWQPVEFIDVYLSRVLGRLPGVKLQQAVSCNIPRTVLAAQAMRLVEVVLLFIGSGDWTHCVLSSIRHYFTVRRNTPTLMAARWFSLPWLCGYEMTDGGRSLGSTSGNVWQAADSTPLTPPNKTSSSYLLSLSATSTPRAGDNLSMWLDCPG